MPKIKVAQNGVKHFLVLELFNYVEILKFDKILDFFITVHRRATNQPDG